VTTARFIGYVPFPALTPAQLHQQTRQMTTYQAQENNWRQNAIAFTRLLSGSLGFTRPALLVEPFRPRTVVPSQGLLALSHYSIAFSPSNQCDATLIAAAVSAMSRVTAIPLNGLHDYPSPDASYDFAAISAYALSSFAAAGAEDFAALPAPMSHLQLIGSAAEVPLNPLDTKRFELAKASAIAHAMVMATQHRHNLDESSSTNSGSSSMPNSERPGISRRRNSYISARFASTQLLAALSGQTAHIKADSTTENVSTSSGVRDPSNLQAAGSPLLIARIPSMIKEESESDATSPIKAEAAIGASCDPMDNELVQNQQSHESTSDLPSELLRLQSKRAQDVRGFIHSPTAFSDLEKISLIRALSSRVSIKPSRAGGPEDLNENDVSLPEDEEPEVETIPLAPMPSVGLFRAPTVGRRPSIVDIATSAAIASNVVSVNDARSSLHDGMVSPNVPTTPTADRPTPTAKPALLAFKSTGGGVSANSTASAALVAAATASSMQQDSPSMAASISTPADADGRRTCVETRRSSLARLDLGAPAPAPHFAHRRRLSATPISHPEESGRKDIVSGVDSCGIGVSYEIQDVASRRLQHQHPQPPHSIFKSQIAQWYDYFDASTTHLTSVPQPDIRALVFGARYSKQVSQVGINPRVVRLPYPVDTNLYRSPLTKDSPQVVLSSTKSLLAEALGSLKLANHLASSELLTVETALNLISQAVATRRAKLTEAAHNFAVALHAQDVRMWLRRLPTTKRAVKIVKQVFGELSFFDERVGQPDPSDDSYGKPRGSTLASVASAFAPLSHLDPGLDAFSSDASLIAATYGWTAAQANRAMASPVESFNGSIPSYSPRIAPGAWRWGAHGSAASAWEQTMMHYELLLTKMHAEHDLGTSSSKKEEIMFQSSNGSMSVSTLLRSSPIVQQLALTQDGLSQPLPLPFVTPTYLDAGASLLEDPEQLRDAAIIDLLAAQRTADRIIHSCCDRWTPPSAELAADLTSVQHEVSLEYVVQAPVRLLATLSQTSMAICKESRSCGAAALKFDRAFAREAMHLERRAPILLPTQGSPSKTYLAQPSLRGKFWYDMSGARDLRSRHRPGYYASLVEFVSQPDIKLRHVRNEIRKDVTRALTEHPMYRAIYSTAAASTPGLNRSHGHEGTKVPFTQAVHTVLDRLLAAYAARNSDSVGYCQGMNYLAATILTQTLDMEQVLHSFRIRVRELILRPNIRAKRRQQRQEAGVQQPSHFSSTNLELGTAREQPGRAEPGSFEINFDAPPPVDGEPFQQPSWSSSETIEGQDREVSVWAEACYELLRENEELTRALEEYELTSGVVLDPVADVPITEGEERAFWILCTMVDSRIGYYNSHMCTLRVDQLVLQQIIDHFLPDIAQHFACLGITLNDFTASWLLCLFAEGPISHSTAVKLWDLVYLRGDIALLWFVLRLIHSLRGPLLSMTAPDQLLCFLLKMPASSAVFEPDGTLPLGCDPAERISYQLLARRPLKVSQRIIDQADAQTESIVTALLEAEVQADDEDEAGVFKDAALPMERFNLLTLFDDCPPQFAGFLAQLRRELRQIVLADTQKSAESSSQLDLLLKGSGKLQSSLLRKSAFQSFLSPDPWPTLVASQLPSPYAFAKAFSSLVFPPWHLDAMKGSLGGISGLFERLFIILDPYRTGSMPWKSFVAASRLMLSSAVGVAARIRLAFSFCDIDGDGYISPADLCEALTILHVAYLGRAISTFGSALTPVLSSNDKRTKQPVQQLGGTSLWNREIACVYDDPMARQTAMGSVGRASLPHPYSLTFLNENVLRDDTGQASFTYENASLVRRTGDGEAPAILAMIFSRFLLSKAKSGQAQTRLLLARQPLLPRAFSDVLAPPCAPCMMLTTGKDFSCAFAQKLTAATQTLGYIVGSHQKEHRRHLARPVAMHDRAVDITDNLALAHANSAEDSSALESSLVSGVHRSSASAMHASGLLSLVSGGSESNRNITGCGDYAFVEFMDDGRYASPHSSALAVAFAVTAAGVNSPSVDPASAGVANLRVSIAGLRSATSYLGTLSHFKLRNVPTWPGYLPSITSSRLGLLQASLVVSTMRSRRRSTFASASNDASLATAVHASSVSATSVPPDVQGPTLPRTLLATIFTGSSERIEEVNNSTLVQRARNEQLTASAGVYGISHWRVSHALPAQRSLLDSLQQDPSTSMQQPTSNSESSTSNGTPVKTPSRVASAREAATAGFEPTIQTSGVLAPVARCLQQLGSGLASREFSQMSVPYAMNIHEFALVCGLHPLLRLFFTLPASPLAHESARFEIELDVALERILKQ